MATTVERISFSDYHVTRTEDGVVFHLHAVNVSCTGWSIRPVTSGYAQPGWHLFKDIPKDRALEIARSATERAMTYEQARQMKWDYLLGDD